MQTLKMWCKLFQSFCKLQPKPCCPPKTSQRTQMCVSDWLKYVFQWQQSGCWDILCTLFSDCKKCTEVTLKDTQGREQPKKQMKEEEKMQGRKRRPCTRNDGGCNVGHQKQQELKNTWEEENRFHINPFGRHSSACLVGMKAVWKFSCIDSLKY